jgi:hypothetical protein
MPQLTISELSRYPHCLRRTDDPEALYVIGLSRRSGGMSAAPLDRRCLGLLMRHFAVDEPDGLIGKTVMSGHADACDALRQLITVVEAEA